MRKKIKTLLAITAISFILPTLPAYSTRSSDLHVETEEEKQQRLAEEYADATVDQEPSNDSGALDTSEAVYGSDSEDAELSAEPSESDDDYMIIDGNYYAKDETTKTPNDNVTIGGVASTKGTGFITIAAQVPSTVHEEAYVYVTNINTYKQYGVYLYEVNNYSTVICLPTGTYIVSEGGLTADIRGNFFADTKSFTVNSGSNMVIVGIHSFDEYEDDAEENTEEAESSEKEDTSETPTMAENAAAETSVQEEYYDTDETDQSQNYSSDNQVAQQGSVYNIKNIILSILFVLIPLAGVFFAWKKFGNQQSRGFDD